MQRMNVMQFYKRFALLALAAALQILSLSPLNLYWLAFVFAVPLFFILEKEKRLWALLLGFFAYRFLTMSGVVYFVLDPIMFTASIAIFLGFPLSFWLTRKLSDKLAFLLAPVFWTFWDYLSARYTALPDFLMMAGNALGDSPFLGLASFWGITSLTFFVLLVNLLVFRAARSWRENRNPALISAAGVITILLAAWLTSSALLRENRESYELRQRSAGVILVSQKNGWDDTFRNPNLNKADLERLIAEHLNDLKKRLEGMDFDLLVLPEAMIDLVQPDYDTNAFLMAGYGNLARDLGKNLAGNATVIEDGKRRNAIFFFNQKGEVIDVFYKKYLAITGEYWPFGNWRPFYFNWVLKTNPGEFDDYAIFKPENNFVRGETKVVRVQDLPAGEAGLVLAPSICIEVHYPAEMRKRVDLGANAILNTSSNLWAPDPGVGQYVKLTNKLRRIESVWLKTPILVNGRKEPPMIVLPDGEIRGPDSRIETGDYEILPVELKF